jgi:hypothetical protein
VTALKSRSLFWFTSAVLAGTAACNQDIPVDDPNENPGINVPVGVIRGTANYIGPGPCFYNGHVQGALVLLVFDYNNPPPPEGLATTAVNLATIPGDLLFQSLPRPSDPAKGGPSDDVKKRVAYCPPLDSEKVIAAADWTITEMHGGRYQIRAFYSRQNKFSPLFDFANLPVAGDEIGGAVLDPSAAQQTFLEIDVGVPDPANPGQLIVPQTGFVKAGVPVFAGTPLVTNRPYFYVDYAGSRGFKNVAENETAKDVATAYKTKCNETDGKCYDDRITGEEIGIIFPQDHPITSEQKLTCLGSPDINCSALEYAEKSLPSIHFKYGFPGNPDDPAGTPDAWIAKNAKPATGFGDARPQPYYGVDPLSSPASVTTAGTETPESKKFALSRNVFHSTVAKENGQPSILVDNEALESLAFIADLYPGVVLAKLQEDDEGNLIAPGIPQTDPIVIIQGFTLRGNSMKATSESALIGGPFCSEPTPACGDVGAKNPLHKPGGFELVDDFTAMIRPAALCVKPELSPELKGTLVLPYELDPNPDNTSDKKLINPKRILETQAARVADVDYGCIPAGYYSINVVQPTGQAWSLPNLMGTCSYTPGGKLVEDCYRAPDTLTSTMIGTGFPKRPYVASQMVFRLDPNTQKPLLDPDGNPIPQVVKVTPSARCMHKIGKTWVSNAVHEDANHDGIFDSTEDKNGNNILDFAVPDICRVQKAAGAACIDNEQCATHSCDPSKKVCAGKANGAECKRGLECASAICGAGGKCAATK